DHAVRPPRFIRSRPLENFSRAGSRRASVQTPSSVSRAAQLEESSPGAHVSPATHPASPSFERRRRKHFSGSTGTRILWAGIHRKRVNGGGLGDALSNAPEFGYKPGKQAVLAPTGLQQRA